MNDSEMMARAEAAEALAELRARTGDKPPMTVSTSRLRGMVQMLYPCEITPQAKRQLLALCEEAER